MVQIIPRSASLIYSSKNLYIPHGSDNTLSLPFSHLCHTFHFISHMVQIIRRDVLSSSITVTDFISHMVQIIPSTSSIKF